VPSTKFKRRFAYKETSDIKSEIFAEWRHPCCRCDENQVCEIQTLFLRFCQKPQEVNVAKKLILVLLGFVFLSVLIYAISLGELRIIADDGTLLGSF
jgi:hypothetical protein